MPDIVNTNWAVYLVSPSLNPLRWNSELLQVLLRHAHSLRQGVAGGVEFSLCLSFALYQLCDRGLLG